MTSTPDHARYPAPRLPITGVDELDPHAMDGSGTMRYGDTAEDHHHDNTRRAGFAAAALCAYAELTGTSSEEPATVLADLYGDLQHLADALDLDADERHEHGREHYDAEVTGQWM